MLSSPLSIPTVTEHDLLTFHLQTFGKPFQAASVAEPNGETYTNEYYDHYDEEEHDLGYYPDGTKRTLTDQEIEIFRHSEIHALLRAKELRDEEREEGLASESEPASEGEILEDHHHQSPTTTPKVSAAASVASGEEAVVDDDKDDDDEDEEYARFLEQERTEFAEAAAKRREERRWSQSLSRDGNDRTVSTRRKVREMDEVRDQEVALDY